MKKKHYFKIEIRRTCKICSRPITKKRWRTFCSKKCRTRSYTIKNTVYRRNWQRQKWAKWEKGKIRCLICHRWYYQPGSHTAQFHKMPAREYREQFDLPVKRGILSLHLRELKARQAIENGTYKNLKAGKKHWYKKGDKRAIKNTFYKGKSYLIPMLSQDIYPHYPRINHSRVSV